jgi:hypothetical protein
MVIFYNLVMKRVIVIIFIFSNCAGAAGNSDKIENYSTPQELAWCTVQLEELAEEYITNLDIYELNEWSNNLNILEEVIPMTNLNPVDVWYHEDKIPNNEDKIETHLSPVKRKLVSDKLFETSSRMLQSLAEYDRLCNFWRANYEKSK